MLRTVVVLFAMIAAQPVAIAEHAQDSTRPLAAFALPVAGEIMVGWVPGPVAAARYDVYGLQAGQPVLLDSVTGTTHAFVGRGYAAYAVRAVTGEHESEPTTATDGSETCRITIDWTPPPPSVSMGGCIGVEVHDPAPAPQAPLSPR